MFPIDHYFTDISFVYIFGQSVNFSSPSPSLGTDFGQRRFDPTRAGSSVRQTETLPERRVPPPHVWRVEHEPEHELND